MARLCSIFASLEQEDFYIESGRYVFTAAYHLKRGHCCGSGCRHCPYDPPHTEQNRHVAEDAPSPVSQAGKASLLKKP
jgi:hypothetical protein